MDDTETHVSNVAPDRLKERVIESLSVKQSVADQLDNLEIYDGRQYKPQWGSV